MIGRSELSPEAVATLDERLSELQRRDRATLTHPEEDAPRTQPWFDPQPDAQWRIAYNDLDFELGELTSEEVNEEAESGFQTGLPRLADVVRTARPVRLRGAVHELTGLVLQASVTGVRIGEVCEVSDPDSGPRDHL